MLLTLQQLPVMCEICCEFFIFQQNNVSAQWARIASVSVSPISDTFHQACGLNPVNYHTCIEIQQRVCVRQIHNVNGPTSTLWHECHGFEQRIINNATDKCSKRLWVCVHNKNDFLIIQFDCKFYICTFNVLVWWKLQVRWYYCVEYIRISPFLISTFYKVV